MTSGHIPAYPFMIVTMGSTAVLLTGWRSLLSTLLPNNAAKKDDVYRRGNPFELFEVSSIFFSTTVLSLKSLI